MVRHALVLMFVAVLAVAFSSVTLADDTKQEKKKEAKAGQMTSIKSVTCDPDCGFMVRSHDEKEIIEVVKVHAKTHHDKTVTDDDVRGMMKTKDMKEMKEKKEKQG